MKIKDFDQWNAKKKLFDKKQLSKKLYFHEREIWWCSVGVNIGVEMDGKNHDFERPILIVKKFNGMMFWGVPLTSKPKKHPYSFEIKHRKGVSFANLSQSGY